MKALLAALVPVGLAALGGALAVYGGYDDSPGGSLLGVLLIVGALVFEVRGRSRAAA